MKDRYEDHEAWKPIKYGLDWIEAKNKLQRDVFVIEIEDIDFFIQKEVFEVIRNISKQRDHYLKMLKDYEILE